MNSRVLACGMMWTFIVGISPGSEAVETKGTDLGKALYAKKCSTCHGITGDGGGPSAAFLNSRPANFTDPQFWQGDFEKKMTGAMRKGKGEMPSFELKPQEIRAIIEHIKANLKPAGKDDKKP